MCTYDQTSTPYDHIKELYACMAIVSTVRRAISGDCSQAKLRLPAHFYDYVMSLERAEGIFSAHIEKIEEAAAREGQAA